MKKLLQSFGYAIAGMFTVLKEQRNMRIHLLAIIVVTAAGFFFSLTAIEWSVIALTIGLVISAEMMNTSIEILVDLISPKQNEKAGKIKDIAAGSVLATAIIAVIVAVYIFGNKIFNLLL